MKTYEKPTMRVIEVVLDTPIVAGSIQKIEKNYNVKTDSYAIDDGWASEVTFD